MRMSDGDTDLTVKNPYLFLSVAEAKELIACIESQLAAPDAPNHSHINDMSFEHELTVAVYADTNVDFFSERYRRLIREGT